MNKIGKPKPVRLIHDHENRYVVTDFNYQHKGGLQ